MRELPDKSEPLKDEPLVVIARNTPNRSRDAGSIVRYYFMQVFEVLAHPQQFFGAMERDEGMTEALCFGAFSIAIFSVLQGIGHFNILLTLYVFFAACVKTAIGAAVAGFVLKRLGGKASIKDTLRVFAYGKATLLFAWISLAYLPIGGLVAFAYALYLSVLGCRKLHDLSTMKVAVTIGVIGVVGFVFGLFVR